MRFTVTHTDKKSNARTGSLETAHAVVETPVFMPVGTKATVKTLTPDDVKELGYSLILANSFHLFLKPGVHVIEKFNGLHTWMNWDRAILTDSGGFQVYSLAEKMKIFENGIEFQSTLDGGATHFIGPKEAMDIQIGLGADIIMAFDECTSTKNPLPYIEEAMKRTHTWADMCVEHFKKNKREYQALFGIIQGGLDLNLRKQSCAYIQNLPFEGIAIGGLSVGESRDEMYHLLGEIKGELDPARPHYLMGVGEPADILEAVENGIDMFDCVLPTRMARTGTAMIRTGRLNLRNAKCTLDAAPIDKNCSCYTCKNFSVSYLRHLVMEKEILGIHLITVHNLLFMKQCMDEIRNAIRTDTFSKYKKDFLKNYRVSEGE